jgi:S-DNA-T family DNA segregation ATPase FtsK/SpoIIIE
LIYFHDISSFDEFADLLEKPLRKRSQPIEFEVVSEEDKYTDETETEESQITDGKPEPSKPDLTNGQPIVLNGNSSNGKPTPKTPANLTLIVENADEVVEEITEDANTVPPISGTTTKIPVVPFTNADELADDLVALHGPLRPYIRIGQLSVSHP